MADIFISYASEDRGRAEILAIKLQEQGWSVWWDHDLPFGRPFDEVIRAEVDAARCVVALWTENSADSLYVIGEARDALRQNKLISFFLSHVQAKLPYDLQAIQGLELIGWKGDSADADFQRLVRGINALVGPLAQNTAKAERELADEDKVRKNAEDDDMQKGEERRVENERKAEDERRWVQENRDKQPGTCATTESPSTVPPEAQRKKGLVIGVAALVVLILMGWFLASKQKLLTSSPPDSLTNSIGMTFVYIAPGSFTMGSPKDEPESSTNEKQHQVTLTQGFYMQTTEVTQGQWQDLMGSNPSSFKECGKDCPVERVSWNDARDFIKRLNAKEGHDRYRLPTEAQWEFAARAGMQTPFAFGHCLSTDQANYNGKYPYDKCPEGRYHGKTVKVGSLQPNGWGLYDMHGNVWEWCQDWYGDYQKGADPEGPSNGSHRVIRGGAWYDSAMYCRSAFRNWCEPGNRDEYLGFRLVLLPGQ